MKALPSPSLLLWRALPWLVGFNVCAALLAAGSGCSSGAVCYRNTDCPIGSSCDKGQCVRDTPLGSAGSSGGSAVEETPDAGDADSGAATADEPSP